MRKSYKALTADGIVGTIGEVMVEVSEGAERKQMLSLNGLDRTITDREKYVTDYQASVIHLKTMRVGLELEAEKVKLKVKDKEKLNE